MVREFAILLVMVSAALLVYALMKPPRRHRRMGPGQIQEAQDNSFGVFGKTYPEDREPRNRGTRGT